MGYAILVMLGGVGMAMYAKFKDAGDWPTFGGWLIGMVAVAFGMARGRQKRSDIERRD